MKKLFIILSLLVAGFFGLKTAGIEPWKKLDNLGVTETLDNLGVTEKLESLGIVEGQPEPKLEPWTNKNGKTVQLKLVETNMVDGELVGVFYTAENKMASVEASKLSEESAAKLKKLKPTDRLKQNVYAKHFNGNLLKLEGSKLTKMPGLRTPRKYYVFYYTASWCPPCQKFTPSLVKFYNSSKTDNFEIVLISSDDSEAAMNQYAAAKKMPWPQLELSKIASFKTEYPSGLKGIPGIMVTDLEGNVITKGNAYSELPKLNKILSN